MSEEAKPPKGDLFVAFTDPPVRRDVETSALKKILNILSSLKHPS